MEAEAQSTTTLTSNLLMLDEPRVIALVDGKFTYTFKFSRILQSDWEKYFSGIRFTSRNVDKAEETVLDLETAGIELFESKLQSVKGYRGDFTSRPGWQSKILPRHANVVSWTLRAVVPSERESDQPFDPERIEVLLDAVWSVTNPGAETTQFQGLIHRFSAPTAEHKRRFYRAGSTSRVVGGSRNGTTEHALRHRVLFELYDLLILEVEGYGVSGRPLQDAAEIRREMDGYHKVKAVEQLFVGIRSANAQAQPGEAA